MFLPNKTQRLLVCFSNAVYPFLTQLSKAQFIAESSLPSLPELPPCSLTALPSPDQNPTPSHLFPLRFARQLLAAGKNKINLFFHRLIHQLHASPSIKPSVAKMSSPAAGHHRTSPGPFGLLYYRAASAEAAIICLPVLWAGAWEPSLGSV